MHNWHFYLHSFNTRSIEILLPTLVIQTDCGCQSTVVIVLWSCLGVCKLITAICSEESWGQRLIESTKMRCWCVQSFRIFWFCVSPARSGNDLPPETDSSSLLKFIIGGNWTKAIRAKTLFYFPPTDQENYRYWLIFAAGGGAQCRPCHRPLLAVPAPGPGPRTCQHARAQRANQVASKLIIDML